MSSRFERRAATKSLSLVSSTERPLPNFGMAQPSALSANVTSASLQASGQPVVFNQAGQLPIQSRGEIIPDLTPIRVNGATIDRSMIPPIVSSNRKQAVAPQNNMPIQKIEPNQQQSMMMGPIGQKIENGMMQQQVGQNSPKQPVQPLPSMNHQKTSSKSPSPTLSGATSPVSGLGQISPTSSYTVQDLSPRSIPSPGPSPRTVSSSMAQPDPQSYNPFSSGSSPISSPNTPPLTNPQSRHQVEQQAYPSSASPMMKQSSPHSMSQSVQTQSTVQPVPVVNSDVKTPSIPVGVINQQPSPPQSSPMVNSGIKTPKIPQAAFGFSSTQASPQVVQRTPVQQSVTSQSSDYSQSVHQAYVQPQQQQIFSQIIPVQQVQPQIRTGVQTPKIPQAAFNQTSVQQSPVSGAKTPQYQNQYQVQSSPKTPTYSPQVQQISGSRTPMIPQAAFAQGVSPSFQMMQQQQAQMQYNQRFQQSAQQMIQQGYPVYQTLQSQQMNGMMNQSPQGLIPTSGRSSMNGSANKGYQAQNMVSPVDYPVSSVSRISPTISSVSASLRMDKAVPIEQAIVASSPGNPTVASPSVYSELPPRAGVQFNQQFASMMNPAQQAYQQQVQMQGQQMQQGYDPNQMMQQGQPPYGGFYPGQQPQQMNGLDPNAQTWEMKTGPAQYYMDQGMQQTWMNQQYQQQPGWQQGMMGGQPYYQLPLPGPMDILQPTAHHSGTTLTFSQLSQLELNRIHADLTHDFDVLKELYPSYGIRPMDPNLASPEYLALKYDELQRKKEYIQVKSNANWYKAIIVFGTIALEKLLCKCKIPATGIAKNQVMAMVRHERLLMKLDKRGIFGFTEDWPVPVQIAFFIALDVLAMIGINLLGNNPLGLIAKNAYGQFVELSEKEKKNLDLIENRDLNLDDVKTEKKDEGKLEDPFGMGIDLKGMAEGDMKGFFGGLMSQFGKMANGGKDVLDGVKPEAKPSFDIDDDSDD